MNRMRTDSYFRWLSDQLIDTRHVSSPEETYSSLFSQLLNTPFVVLVPFDSNREVDGKMLRYEFAEAHRLPFNEDEMLAPCSMLELLLSVSRMLEFEASDTQIGYTTDVWFWILLGHIGIDSFSDSVYLDSQSSAKNVVDSALSKLIERRYCPSGQGGLFPLAYPAQDQREVEIWYQMSAYLLERSGLVD